MKDHCESEDNRPQGSETALRSVYFPSQSFCLFPSVKTGPIIALYCIFSRHLVSLSTPPRSEGSVAVRMILKTTASPGADLEGTQNLALAQYLRTVRQVGCGLCYSKSVGYCKCYLQ